jgi:hypothetical protein
LHEKVVFVAQQLHTIVLATDRLAAAPASRGQIQLVVAARLSGGGFFPQRASALSAYTVGESDATLVVDNTTVKFSVHPSKDMQKVIMNLVCVCI